MNVNRQRFRTRETQDRKTKILPFLLFSSFFSFSCGERSFPSATRARTLIIRLRSARLTLATVPAPASHLARSHSFHSDQGRSYVNMLTQIKTN